MSNFESVSILQWNVRYTTPAKQIRDYRKSISDAFGEPQIVCLEEVVLPDKTKDFAISHQFRDHTMAVSSDLKGKYEGLSIESSLEKTDYEEVELSSGDPVMWFAASATRRVCQLASYRVASWEEALHIAHVHLSPPVPVLNSRQRKSERDHLVDIVRDRAKLGRFVLLGDFNASPSSRLMKAMKGLEIIKPPTNSDISTYRLQLGGAAIKKQVLDYLMVSQDLEATSAVLSAGPSDHSPLLSGVTKRD